MEYLLDTHTLLWFLSNDKQLSSKALATIKPANTICFTSIVSLWEIAIKSSLNKLNLHVPFSDFEKQLYQNDIQILPLTFQDILTSHSQPFHHRDPFDRIIISQAIHHGLTIITKDSHFTQYAVNTLW